MSDIVNTCKFAAKVLSGDNDLPSVQKVLLRAADAIEKLTPKPLTLDEFLADPIEGYCWVQQDGVIYLEIFEHHKAKWWDRHDTTYVWPIAKPEVVG